MGSTIVTERPLAKFGSCALNGVSVHKKGENVDWINSRVRITGRGT